MTSERPTPIDAGAIWRTKRIWVGSCQTLSGDTPKEDNDTQERGFHLDILNSECGGKHIGICRGREKSLYRLVPSPRCETELIALREIGEACNFVFWSPVGIELCS